MDALQDLKNIEEQPKSFIVHQEEAMTLNKTTNCNRKSRKTLNDSSIVKIFLSSVRFFSRQCVTISGHSAIALTPQFDRNETHGLHLHIEISDRIPLRERFKYLEDVFPPKKLNETHTVKISRKRAAKRAFTKGRAFESISNNRKRVENEFRSINCLEGCKRHFPVFT